MCCDTVPQTANPGQDALCSIMDVVASNPDIASSGSVSPLDAEQCLRALLPHCRAAHITRVGDLTGLDRLGIPVVQCVRPAALSEVTSLGKGRCRAEAAIGAIMESLERFYAESIPAERVYSATANELQIEPGLFDSSLLDGNNGNWRAEPIDWINGLNLVSGEVQPVPLELVDTRYVDTKTDGSGVFIRSTTGLACHVTPYQSFLHGLFECIERDAMARAFATHGFFDRMRISPDGLSAAIDDLVALAHGHAIAFGLWLAPSPTGIPVVWCQAIETSQGEPILALPTEGYCAAATLANAAVGAMMEAMAARAGAISGARDDQTRGHYLTSSHPVVIRARHLILDWTPPTPHKVIEMAVPAGVGDLIQQVVAAGLGPPLTVCAGIDKAAGVYCIRTLLPRSLPLLEVR